MICFIQRIIILAIATAGLLPMYAQNKEISLSVPKIIGVARITADEVNLRKSPSESAPQLVTDTPDEDGNCESITTWSDHPKTVGAERIPFRLYTGYEAPIVEQTDGWVRILVSGQAVWVKDTFAMPFPLGAFSEISEKPEFQPYEPTFRHNGAFKDYCSIYYNNEMGGTGFYIGKLHDNLAIMPLIVDCYPISDASVEGLIISKNADGGIEIKYGCDLTLRNEYGMDFLNLSNLTDHQFQSLISVAYPAEEEFLWYVSFELPKLLILKPSSYNGKLNTVTETLPTVTDTSSRIYDSPDTSPEFPGGAGKMMAWIGQNLKYPEHAQQKNVQGRVIVRCVIKTDGSIADATIVKGVEHDLDAEALRLVNSMPRWKAATVNGKPVNVWYSIPISFRLHL